MATQRQMRSPLLHTMNINTEPDSSTKGHENWTSIINTPSHLIPSHAILFRLFVCLSIYKPLQSINQSIGFNSNTQFSYHIYRLWTPFNCSIHTNPLTIHLSLERAKREVHLQEKEKKTSLWGESFTFYAMNYYV